jgi:hypothetical protein
MPESHRKRVEVWTEMGDTSTLREYDMDESPQEVKHGKVFRVLQREAVPEHGASRCCWVEKIWRVHVPRTTSNCIQPH